ncbi:MAG TPA: rhodanese-like domain-containing protein [Caldilineaceae bacterium]|nr:rhodanese-like domain-containing protein [Caldilineaceae bacterium]
MKGYQELVTEANAVITTITVAEAAAHLGSDEILFIDLRGDAELLHTGIIPGALHVQRGMLELIIDPASPYYNLVFGSGKTFIFYCGSGGRSALAAQRAQEMGLERVVRMGGGLKAWKEAGYALEPWAPRTHR